jgi:hypothetical protein
LNFGRSVARERGELILAIGVGKDAWRAINISLTIESQKELLTDTSSFHSRVKGRVAYALKPTLRNQKVLCLTIERDHQVLENCLAS